MSALAIYPRKSRSKTDFGICGWAGCTRSASKKVLICGRATEDGKPFAVCARCAKRIQEIWNGALS